MTHIDQITFYLPKKQRLFSLSLTFLSFDLEKRRQTFVFYGFDVVVVYILRNKEGEREIESNMPCSSFLLLSLCETATKREAKSIQRSF